MRSYMGKSGWERSAHLPEGWIYQSKDSKKEDKKIISREGIYFTTYQGAKEFIQMNDKYSEEDLESITSLASNLAAARRYNDILLCLNLSKIIIFFQGLLFLIGLQKNLFPGAGKQGEPSLGPSFSFPQTRNSSAGKDRPFST